MTRSRVCALAVVALLTATSCSHTAGGGSLPLRRVADVVLPGVASRFDYQDVDVGRRRLFVAHLGASRIDVVDLVSLRVVATISHPVLRVMGPNQR